MMTFDEVMRRMLQVFPDGELGTDNDGQLVVYTGLYPGGTATCTVYCAREPEVFDLRPDRGFKGDEEC